MTDADKGADTAPIADFEKPKTAVIVIHGMGEQRPMETLTHFVDAVWIYDKAIGSRHDKTLFSKPDDIAGSFELRRLTTRHVALERGEDKRVDFFEFYWAHLMTGNTTRAVMNWLAGLLWRSPHSIPKRLRRYWYFGVPIIAAFILIALFSGVDGFLKLAHDGLGTSLLPPLWTLVLSLAAALLSLLVTWWVVPVAGDAARYLSPLPDNVEARQKIREAGIDLLTKLHASGRYDRIIVVGHSLGTVIGYDVLNFAWARLSEESKRAWHTAHAAAMTALSDLERATGDLVHADAATQAAMAVAFRAAQRCYQDTLRSAAPGKPPLWAVTDFVTLGSPLSKADVLISQDEVGFARRKKAREFPTCPPFLEKDKPAQKKYRLSYPFDAPCRVPHFGAVFAPVVWTNVYFQTAWLVFGDPVGGALRDLFGKGLVDVQIPAQSFRFWHTHYWSEPQSKGAWLGALRRAVNLKGEADMDLWQAQAGAAEIDAAKLPTA